MKLEPKVDEFWWINTPTYGLRVVRVDNINKKTDAYYTIGCGHRDTMRTALKSFVAKCELPKLE